MSVTISVEGKSVITTKGGGKGFATIPDICCIPIPFGKLPLPFPNIAKAENAKLTSFITQGDTGKFCCFGSYVEKTEGDAFGILKGIISGETEGKAFWLASASTVMVEGRPVVRKGDLYITNTINTLALTGMKVDDVEEPETGEWVKFRVIEDDGSEDPSHGVKGVNVKITLSDNSTKEIESGVNGVIRFYDLDPGNCSVELNEPEDSAVTEITDRWPVEGLATMGLHKIGIKIKKRTVTSG